MHMPSVTFFALLGEGHKLEVAEMKKLLTISAYPHMDSDNQELVRDSLQLPDDILSDILDGETRDDINILKEALEDGN